MNDQPDMFEQNWRNTDPHTSRAAGLNAKHFAHQHHASILKALCERPMAAEEIADRCRLAGNVAPNWPTRRLCELERGGLVIPTEEIHRNRSGRSARRYRLTEAGKEALKR